jgi:hypothetical protein
MSVVRANSDLSKAELAPLVKAANDRSDPNLAANARVELATRTIRAILNQGPSLPGGSKAVVKAGAAPRPDLVSDMTRLLKAPGAAPVVKAGKTDLSKLTPAELKQQVLTGSTSERNAALQELGLRTITGVDSQPADTAPVTPAPAGGDTAAAPVAKGSAMAIAQYDAAGTVWNQMIDKGIEPTPAMKRNLAKLRKRAIG